MNVLITGASGLLGQYLNAELSPAFKILCLYNTKKGNIVDFPNINADIRNEVVIRGVFNDFRPDTVVHTAAIADNADAKLLPPAVVYNTNVRGTEIIARLCDEYGAKLIYTSTDLVYAGYRGSMLKEDAKLVPLSLYAESKLMGEIKIKNTFDNYIILRTALLFGLSLNHTTHHFSEMYERMKKGVPSRLFFDQYKTPLALKEAARIIRQLINTPVNGEIINFGGKERLSRVDMAEVLCEHGGFDKGLIEPVSITSIPGLPQVADVSMDTGKLDALGIQRQSYEASIAEILRDDTTLKG